MSDDYLWGVHPRSADDPLVASGESNDRKTAQQEVELVLGTKPQTASWGTVTGPRDCHLVCRRDGLGGFTWEDRNGSRTAGPRPVKASKTARPRKRDADPGRLYRDTQNDYWDARARTARRNLALRRFTRGALIVVIFAVVIVGAAYLAHHLDPRLSIPGFANAAAPGPTR